MVETAGLPTFHRRMLQRTRTVEPCEIQDSDLAAAPVESIQSNSH